MEELIIKEKEIKEKIVELINTSQMPAFILRNIFLETLEQLNILVEQQYIEAKKIKEKKEGK